MVQSFINALSKQDEFNIVGFTRDLDKKEVDEKPKEAEYDVTIRQNEDESKYYNEKKDSLATLVLCQQKIN